MFHVVTFHVVTAGLLATWNVPCRHVPCRHRGFTGDMECSMSSRSMSSPRVYWRHGMFHVVTFHVVTAGLLATWNVPCRHVPCRHVPCRHVPCRHRGFTGDMECSMSSRSMSSPRVYWRHGMFHVITCDIFVMIWMDISINNNREIKS